MNISEKIALDCGVKISEPFIDKAFYPLPDEEFIVFDTRTNYPDNVYDHYSDVVDLIRPYLKERKIAIYEFAVDGPEKLQGDKCFIKINAKQEAYIISKSSLVVANDHYSSYIAAILNKTCITLYSSFSEKNRAPVWNKKSQIAFESDRGGNKPSYNVLPEKFKSVNLIDPFKVAKQILDCLGIENDLDKYDLLHLGKDYRQKVLEIVPDFVADPQFLAEQSINLRLDYVEDLDARVLVSWLLNRKANIITNKDLNVNVLMPYTQNIINVTVIASDDISEQFLDLCKALGFDVKIYCSDRDKFEYFKFKFLNWEVVKDFEDDIDLFGSGKVKPTSKYMSSKRILSKGNTYSCKASYLLDIPLDKSSETVILSKEFEEESSFFKIYDEN